MKKVMIYGLYLLVVWGSFRYFYSFPAAVEELMFKPLIWLIPLFWWNFSLKNRVLFFEYGTFKSMLFGGLVGIFYFLLLSNGKKINIDFDIFGVALVTAVVEEMVFSGFVLGYLINNKYSENLAIFVTAVLAGVLRLPIMVFDFHLGSTEMFFGIIFVIAYSVVSGLLRVKTRNVSSSIVARLFLNLSLLV